MKVQTCLYKGLERENELLRAWKDCHSVILQRVSQFLICILYAIMQFVHKSTQSNLYF